MIRLEFPIRALAKQSFRAGKYGAYQPKNVVAFKNAIRTMTNRQLTFDHTLLDGCLFVTICFTFALPKSAPKSKRNAVANENNLVYMNVKPDVDNLTKAMFDAMNGVLWTDDARVVSFHCQKVYGLTDCITVCVNAEPNGYCVSKDVKQSSKWLLDAVAEMNGGKA